MVVGRIRQYKARQVSLYHLINRGYSNLACRRRDVHVVCFFTAKKRWLFQPWVGLSLLQALEHKVIIWFPLYNSTVMSCILCDTLSLRCVHVYRVHVSR